MTFFKPREKKDVRALLPAQALAACLLFSFASISLEEGFLFLAVVFWAARVIKEKQRLSVPSFFLPLFIYAALSILSSAFSVNPAVSFRECRELGLYLIVPVAYMSFSTAGEILRANLAVLLSAAASIVYSFYRYFFLALPGERIKGFMGHYMTQAGLLVLFCSLAFGLFVFSRKKINWLWGAAFFFALPALALTMTRSAWIGAAVVVCVILGLYKPKLLAVVPVAAILIYFVSPAPFKDRIESIFSQKGYSNRMRVEYLKAGLKIIRDFPLTGTGPDTVDMVFQNPKYGLSEEAKRNVHLHNNFTQIAAERGIPALLAWLLFAGWTLASLGRLLKSGSPELKALAAAAIAAILAILVAGIFEYNFGDSEVTMLLLYILTVPFAFLRAKKAGP